MAENLSQQLSESLQNAQRNAETMRHLQMVKNTLFGVGGAAVGGMGHMAMGAYAGIGAMSPFAGASSSFLNQAMGRGSYVSPSAFGPRVGGPGGLIYEAGLGGFLNRASGGYLFQDVNRSISQTADQMRDNARSELRLRGQEFFGNVKYGALTLGGILDDSLVYRGTGGFDERIKTGLTRQLADQMGGAIGRTGVASGIVDRVTSRVGRINAEKMGYGLGASQQEELSKLAIAFGGPIGTSSSAVADKSVQFLDEFSKSVGKLGVSADKLMSGYQELVKAGAANLDSAKLFKESIQTARSQNMFGSFGTDEFITQLASQTAIAASSRGLRGAQAATMRDARFTAVANMAREYELMGLNQLGVFGTGFAGLQNAQQAKEQLFGDAMAAGGLFAATNADAASRMQSGGMSGFAGLLRGRAGSTMTSLQHPLFALRYKLFPEVDAARQASSIGPGGVLAAALNRPSAFHRNRMLRDVSYVLKRLDIPTNVSEMTDDDKLEVGKILANAYGVTDEKGMGLFASYLANTPDGIKSAMEGKPLSEKQLAALNLKMSNLNALDRGLRGSDFNSLFGYSGDLESFMKNMNPDLIPQIARNNMEGLNSGMSYFVKELFTEIIKNPAEAEKKIGSLKNDYARNFVRTMIDESGRYRTLFLSNLDPYRRSKYLDYSAVDEFNNSVIQFSGMDPIINDRTPLTAEGAEWLSGKMSNFAISFLRNPISTQQVDGTVNKNTGSNKVEITNTVNVKVINPDGTAKPGG